MDGDRGRIDCAFQGVQSLSARLRQAGWKSHWGLKPFLDTPTQSRLCLGQAAKPISAIVLTCWLSGPVRTSWVVDWVSWAALERGRALFVARPLLEVVNRVMSAVFSSPAMYRCVDV